MGGDMLEFMMDAEEIFRRRNLPEVTVWCDGGCSPNPGTGVWGAVILFPKGNLRTYSGRVPNTTNQRMELTAAFEALEMLKFCARVKVYSDSTYLVEGMGGRMAKKANLDLWKRLHEATSGHEVAWFWVKGHSGDVNNELCDRLAKEAMANG